MRLRNARSLESLFHTIIVVAGAAGACAVSLSSCGGKTSSDESAVCELAEDARVGGCWQFNVALASGANAAACGLPEGDAGEAYNDRCAKFCGTNPGGYVTCSYVTATNSVRCNVGCPVDGRRPPELVDAPTDRATLGAYLATMSFHEAASVDAFAILHEELHSHGAPRSILRALARARLDEIRHARRAGALARKFGSTPRRARVGRPPLRDLMTIALENAREGCARETLGALIGLHQATHAKTGELRGFYRSIARDELRHTALSWRMHAWLVERLAPDERRAVDAALTEALAAMDLEIPTELRETLGLPTRAQFSTLRIALSSSISA